MFDFCGIGNACIDVVAKVDDDFLRDWGYPKSICTHLSLEEANALEATLATPEYIPGGCGANTAASITALGGKAAFMGRVANDAIGQMFLNDMKTRGIHYAGIPDTASGAGSTRIFTLITPDAERTFASYYGVQENLSEEDLDEESIRRSKFMHLDGYALNAKRGGETFLKAAHIARQAGNKTVLCPSDLSILTRYRDVVSELSKISDILICNEQEALFQTGAASLTEAIGALQGQFEQGAITCGKDGAYIFNSQNVIHVPTQAPSAPVVDTNGAGDHFAGGFLYGLSQGWTQDRAGRLGHLCAASVITYTGARPQADYKPFVDRSAAKELKAKAHV